MIKSARVRITDRTRQLMTEAMNIDLLDQGRYTEKLEAELADWFGVKYAIGVANGTMADACALAAIRYLNEEEKRNEVIVPALTFIAQINAVYYNHLKPIFIDACPDGNMDVDQIELKINEKTLAIMPVHLLGRPAKMHKISELARKYNLFVVEDACEAMGSLYYGTRVGTLGDVGCFSFYVSHSLATGEGGVVITNNKRIADLVRSLRNHGRQSESLEEKFQFPRVGFSAKMNCMEAIIGLGGMDNIDESLKTRRAHCLTINRLSRIESFCENPGEMIIPHGYPLMVSTNERRQKLLSVFTEKYGIEARQIFSSVPTQSGAYKYLNDQEHHPVAEDIGRRGIYLPCHDGLSTKDLQTIILAIQQEENLNAFGK